MGTVHVIAPSQPYRPSNGTEGMIFYEVWCAHCKHENYSDSHPERGCQILADTMCYDIGDPEYPKEWIIGPGGARCTAFEERR